MAKTPVRAALLAGLTLWLGAAAVARANPQVVAILKYAPIQPGIQLSTPTADEIPKCDVKVVPGPRKGSGYELKDPAGKLLRRFFDTNGDSKIDLFSYFKDGVEVYREIDTDADDRPDMFRWLNTGGMKWGQDLNKDGKIDTWRMISAEEAAEEAFQALGTNDFDRLKTLFLSDEDMKFLKLIPAEVERLMKLQKDAREKFTSTRAKLPQLAGAKFERLESAVPNCGPAEGLSEKDVIKFPSRLILFRQDAPGAKDKHDWLDTGEMIQVGYAWRLTDVPGPHAADRGGDATSPPTNPKLQELLTQLDALEKDNPIPLVSPVKDDKAAQYNLKRVALIQKILPLVEEKERDNWTRQMCDNLSTAYQAGSDAALAHLAALKKDLAEKSPTSNILPYATYREIWAVYSKQIADAPDGKRLANIQEEWLEKLSKFVGSYPKADDTPDALLQLAMGCEHAEKDEESKRWYQQIYNNFPTNSLAEKARGAERRLGLIGREMELKAKTVDGKDFNLVDTKGKVIVVYYWSSTVEVCKRDFGILKTLVAGYEAKGVEIVAINLDESKDAATRFLDTQPLKAHHLGDFGKDGGLSGPLGTAYGINSLPTLFLIGRDGRVVNRTLQATDLENALKKAL